MRQSVKNHKMFSVVSGLAYKNKGTQQEQSFPENRTPPGYPITNSQPRKYRQTSNIIKTEQVVFIHLEAHIHVITIKLKEDMNLEERKDKFIGGFGGRQGKWEIINKDKTRRAMRE